MNSYQQQHSFLQNVEGQFEKITSNIQFNTTTKMKQKTYRYYYRQQDDPVWLMPIFNAFQIDIGVDPEQRLGNMIYVDRVECSYTLTELASDNIGPDETKESTSTNQNVLAKLMTDPRLRVLVVTPKRQYRFLPTAGTNSIDPIWPFYSATSGASGYFEPISKPVETSQAMGYGLDIPPNTKKYDIHYDDVKNICNGKIGYNSGSFCFLYRKEFEYDDTTTGLGALQCMSADIEKIIPQIWFIQAPQMDGATPTSARNQSAFQFAFSIRIYYNNV